MRAPPNERTAPAISGGGGSQKTDRSGGLIEKTDSASHRHTQHFADIDADIAIAKDYERLLALKQFRVRKLILDLQIKRDALEDLGAALHRRAA